MQRRVGAQEPRVATYPPYETTAGPAVCDLMDAIGLPMDRWQSFVLQHGLGIGVDGLWTAPTVGTWVSRQNGKGNIILAREIGGLYIFGERLISHSAHLFQTAEEGFMRLKDAIEGSSMLSRRIKSVKEGNSGKGVVTMDGARLRVMARGPNTGRGMTIDCLIPDEAQELDAVQVKSLGPTQSAVPNPQAWYFGTPPSSPEAWAYQLRKAGHAGSPGMAFFDWGASLDLNDPHLANKVANRDLW
jgi:phage terminase large subunit-like protein